MRDGFLVVVALGDSLTAGYRASDPYSIDRRVPYPYQLEELIRQRVALRGSGVQAFVVNAGINGDSTEGMLERFDRSVEAEKPDAVVVWGGINDLGAGRGAEGAMVNLARLYSRCTAIRATPVACTLTPTRRTSAGMLRLNAMIRAHASEKVLILADLYTALADEGGNLRVEYSDDGAHLTPAGYRRVAEETLSALDPLVANMER